MSAIDKGVANIEPPADRSGEWKEGFRLGCKSVAHRLKMVQDRQGLNEVDSELHKLVDRFRGAKS